MMRVDEPLNPRLVRVSGSLLVLGLLVEGVSLIWRHPLAAYLFFYVGLILLLSGFAVFVYCFVAHFLKKKKRSAQS
jgi:apolipoprotein N-acyltransferase